MKKWFLMGLALVSLLVVLAGCAPERLQLDLSGAARIEVRRGGNMQPVTVTDPEEIQILADELGSLTLRKWKSSEGYFGWTYSVKWYDAQDQILGSILFTANDVINHEIYGYFYCSSKPVDTALFQALFAEAE